MKTVWGDENAVSRPTSAVKTFGYLLLVDVLPVFLLLAVLACGMALVSYTLTEPRSVELAVLIEGQP